MIVSHHHEKLFIAMQKEFYNSFIMHSPKKSNYKDDSLHLSSPCILT